MRPETSCLAVKILTYRPDILYTNSDIWSERISLSNQLTGFPLYDSVVCCIYKLSILEKRAKNIVPSHDVFFDSLRLLYTISSDLLLNLRVFD